MCISVGGNFFNSILKKKILVHLSLAIDEH
jgi:hypothetical protein